MKQVVLLILFSLLTVVYGFGQADLQPAAIVNLTRTEQITVRQLRNEVERMERGTGRTLTQSERLQVLDVMINERLVLQATERDRAQAAAAGMTLTVTDNELNEQIQQLRNVLAQQLGRPPTEAEFAQAVRNESGMDVPAFREQLRSQMTVQRYLMFRKGDLLNSIRPPTEQEIQTQFNLARAQFVRPETVRFSMIQVPYGPDAASRARARTLIDRLAAEIGTSAVRFNDVSARSVRPDSGFVAGDGGFLPRNHEAMSVVGPEFMNTAFSLREGEISPVIEGVPGFQIIKITESYPMINLGLNDILHLGTRITVRDHIGQIMLMERQQSVLIQASQELTSELRSGRGTVQIFERNLNW